MLVYSGPFQSTRPVRGATTASRSSSPLLVFQSTRPVRGATHPIYAVRIGTKISIHAPRAGRDRLLIPTSCETLRFQSTRPVRGATASTSPLAYRFMNFNPRAPCGARLLTSFLDGLVGLFQSTRPVRGATTSFRFAVSTTKYFNPRAPCGARPNNISFTGRSNRFQSTRPVRGATA